jgi:hypothetical protein
MEMTFFLPFTYQSRAVPPALNSRSLFSLTPTPELLSPARHRRRRQDPTTPPRQSARAASVAAGAPTRPGAEADGSAPSHALELRSAGPQRCLLPPSTMPCSNASARARPQEQTSAADGAKPNQINNSSKIRCASILRSTVLAIASS